MTPLPLAVPRDSRVRPGASALASLGTAVPPLRVTQREALDFVLARFPVRDATKALYRRVFEHDSIHTRHFALDRLDEVLDDDLDRVNRRFERWAVDLSTRALRRALDRRGLAARALDFLAVTTCTGYLCPGLSAYVAESAGLRPDVATADLVGMGCGAALPALRQADAFLRAHPGALAAVVSAEICSAAMFSDDAVDLVVSNALFGDGAAAAVLRGRRADDALADECRLDKPVFTAFRSVVVPERRDTLRFRTDGGHLRNVLHKDVPVQAGRAVKELTDRLLAENGLAPADVTRWVLHAGGAKVLDALEAALALPAPALAPSRHVLQRYGNMSSPTVLFVLEETLADGPAPGEWGVLASFGAGFSAHAALVRF